MAVDYFLKLDTIDGESKDNTHSKEIEIISWSWNEAQQGTFGQNSGAGSGKVNMGDMSFSMMCCKASTPMMAACASGKHLSGGAILTCRKAAGDTPVEYMKITLKPVMITSYQTGGSSGAEIPIDSFTLNYATIKIEYKGQKDDGTAENAPAFGWDLEKNTKMA